MVVKLRGGLLIPSGGSTEVLKSKVPTSKKYEVLGSSSTSTSS